MPKTTIPLIKGDKTDIDTEYHDAIPVNMYTVVHKLFNVSGYMLCYPGLTSFATGQGLDRGGVYNERMDKHFRVSGTKFIEISNNGTVTVLGTISGTAQVSLPYSFQTQCVVADKRMFLYSSAGFAEVIDSDLGNPIDGVWIDGYYFLTDGEYIYHTDLDDESSIDPLKFATAEFSPDATLGVGKTQDNKAIAFGRYTTEYFADAANPNFAFSRLETRAQNIGIVATHAKCKYEDKWFITGGPKQDAVGVYILGAGQWAKISTREVDQLLAYYTEPELADMRMECRTENDSIFVLVHLPDYTLCYNHTIAKAVGAEYAWSYLKSQVATHGIYRGINGVNDARISKWIYGDRLSSNIGTLDSTVFTQYGEMQEWLLYTPLMLMEGASINELEVRTIPGHTTTLDGSVAFSITNNGLFYGTEAFISYGQPAEIDKRFIIRRLGYVPDKIGFKFRGATKSRMAFASLGVDYE